MNGVIDLNAVAEKLPVDFFPNEQQRLIESLKETSELDADSAGEVIKTVMKSQGVKKGVVMKSLRASLTGDLHGPEILPTFVLLHRKGLALSRLQRALTL